MLDFTTDGPGPQADAVLNNRASGPPAGPSRCGDDSPDPRAAARADLPSACPPVIADGHDADGRLSRSNDARWNAFGERVESARSAGPRDPAADLAAVTRCAAEYRAAGFAICRIPSGEKRPRDAEWSTRSAEPAEFRAGDTPGIQCGSLSDGGRPDHALVCVDLDAREALDRADDHLPPTGMVDGRPGKPRSHRFYLVPVAGIPPWAQSTARQAAAAALAAGRHPGPRIRHLKMTDGRIAIDFIGTGGQVAAPPAVHPSGERRAWVGESRGDPAVVEFEVLWAAVLKLATAVGCRVPADNSLSPTGEQTQRPGRVSGDTSGDDAAVGAEYTIGPDGEVVLDGTTYTSAARVEAAGRYLRGIPDTDLSRSGLGGHATLFRHLSAAVNGFLVRDREIVRDLIEQHYNARLRRLDGEQPGAGFEPWDEAEIDHKLDDVGDDGPPAEKSPGWLLDRCRGSAAPPMDWNNQRRLADGLAAEHRVKFVKDSAFAFDGKAYQPVSDQCLNGWMQTVAETAAEEEYRRRMAVWKQENEAPIAELRQIRGSTALTSISRASPQGVEQEIRRRTSARPTATPRVTRAMVADALASLRALGLLPDDVGLDMWLPDGKPRNWLTVESGVLDLDTRALHPHDPNWFSTVSLPVAYIPGAARPELWLQFLGNALEADPGRIGLFQEVMGACLDRQYDAQWFAVLVGEGGNGKSVALNVVRALLGEQNVASVGLDQLAGGAHRFAAYGLYGRLANVKGDQPYFDSRDESSLKELTGGDLFQFEQKGRQPVFAQNRCKLIFACNAVPTFKDKTEGLWRRFIPIPFGRVVPAGEREPAMLTPAYWAAEMPGILNWALDGLTRLKARKRFELPPASLALVDQHRMDSNPARMFLNEAYKNAPGITTFLPTHVIYDAYTHWCENGGYDYPLTVAAFGKEIGRQFPAAESKTQRQHGKIVRGWTGIRDTTAGVERGSGGGCTA
ncbi:MAG: hypothetical protein JWO38_8220 [Gemmataceae bacterium]|nr:hypothetical protein [Gemmataceae bacterium]